MVQPPRWLPPYSDRLQPLKSVLVPLPRRCDEISQKLSSMLPVCLSRSELKPVILLRCRRKFGMHTNRKMRLHIYTKLYHEVY